MRMKKGFKLKPGYKLKVSVPANKSAKKFASTKSKKA